MALTSSALVLGASGSVGAALMRELVARGGFARIVTFTRRAQPEFLELARIANVELQEVLVPDMSPDTLAAATATALSTFTGDVVGLSVLGIGAGTAKLTIQQHRAIDVELNAAFARALAQSGRARHFALMSAVGADAQAAESGSGAAGGARYNRVKGEAEAAVRASGVPVVSIFRPAMIIGSQHTPWLLEKLLPVFTVFTPSRFRSITVQQIARAMVATSRAVPSSSAVYHYAEMLRLGA